MYYSLSIICREVLGTSKAQKTLEVSKYLEIMYPFFYEKITETKKDKTSDSDRGHIVRSGTSN